MINWTGDVRSPIPDWYKDLAPYCVTMFTNMNDVKEMTSLGFKSDYLQIGYDPNIFNPSALPSADHDVVMLANNYNNAFPLSKYRIDVVNALREEFKDRFGLYGTGWQKCNGNVNNSQILEAGIYAGSKIAISCSHFEYERYFSDRLLRSMGVGKAMVISHNYPGINADFADNTLETFMDIEDLILQCKAYLRNEEARKFMVRQGWEYVSSNYTFKQMVENLETLINKWKNTK